LAVTAAAGAAGPFDGTYSGSQTVQLNNNYQGCADRNIALVIRNSHFTRPWGGDEFGFDVASDGTFNKTGFYNAGAVDRRRLPLQVKLSARAWRPTSAATVVRCICH
jgi:hypothetical protein